jgi:serine/threonine protein kinase
MPTNIPDFDDRTPPFDRLKGIQKLSADRRGGSGEHARHLLYEGLDKRTRTTVLIKVTSKPGIVYEQNINNEIATLATINRELPRSRYFPEIHDHGRLRDGRVFLLTTFFDEMPLATMIGAERMPDRIVTHLRIAIEVARALTELHGLGIFHVDLNPMNVLYRSEKGKPDVRIIDFESSYERCRHEAGEFYDPPTTPGYSAPEVPDKSPDARSDVYSLGAVLYTLMAGYTWTWEGEVGACVAADAAIDDDLKSVLLKAVDRSPARRYRSAQDMLDALGAHLERIWPGRSW